MAVRPINFSGPTNESVIEASWDTMLNGDTGAGVKIAKYPDKTVQVVGTFGVGGTVAVQGSNDGTTWGDCHDPQGTAIAIQDNEPVVIAESPLYLRPNVTAGDGSTDVDVYIVAVAKGL
jgi:hypothetical protein